MSVAGSSGEGTTGSVVPPAGGAGSTEAVPAGTDAGLEEADRIRAAVLSCLDVVELSAGPFGEVASYLPGRKVAGVRVDEQRVEVHIVAAYGRPLREISDQIGRAVQPLLTERALTVAVDDILLPGDTLAGPPDESPGDPGPPDADR